MNSPQQTLAAVYDHSAETYERYWAPALHRRARDLLTRIERPTGAAWTAVDVAAGAGTLALALRDLVGPDGMVVATDRSHGMLRRANAAQPWLPRLQSDATLLPLADACADVVVLAFVLFLLPDAPAAAAEAARVLRPGGWLLAATWGIPDGSTVDAVVREELDAADAPPFPPLPRSDELTDTPERMAALLVSAGLADIHTVARPLDARFDAEEALALRLGAGTLGWRFAGLSAPAQGRVRARAAARLGALPADSFVDESQVLLTTARLR